MDTYRKPAEGLACTGCGICCIAVPCGIGQMLGSPMGEPCRLLEWNDGKSSCGALKLRDGDLYAKRLGIGMGCDSGPEPGDPDEYEGMTAREFIDAGHAGQNFEEA